jgi:hypothetical protein
LSQIHFENGEKILNLLKIDKAKVGWQLYLRLF